MQPAALRTPSCWTQAAPTRPAAAPSSGSSRGNRQRLVSAADRSHVAAARWFAGGVIAAALFSMAPVAVELADYLAYWQVAGSLGIARWALISSLLGVVQIAYGVFLFQLPDRASVLVVALWLTAVAGVYALCLGLTLIANP